jgi:hypothetical protein
MSDSVIVFANGWTSIAAVLIVAIVALAILHFDKNKKKYDIKSKKIKKMKDIYFKFIMMDDGESSNSPDRISKIKFIRGKITVEFSLDFAEIVSDFLLHTKDQTDFFQSLAHTEKRQKIDEFFAKAISKEEVQ